MNTKRLIAIVSLLVGSTVIGLAADQVKAPAKAAPAAKAAAKPAPKVPAKPVAKAADPAKAAVKPVAKAPAKPAPAKPVAKAPAKPAPKPAVDFVRDIKPILEFNCVGCHREGKIKGELRYDRHDLFLKGGEGGAAFVAGQPAKSLMIELVSLPKDDDDVMPSKGRVLTKIEIDKLSKWIAAGAPWPKGIDLVEKKESDFVVKPLPKREGKVISVKVYPANVHLQTKRDKQALVVMATYDDDTTADVTASSTFTLTDESLVEKQKPYLYLPRKEGKAQLSVKVAGFEVKVPVEVKAPAKDRDISFRLDIMPIFLKEGCNTGSCHGSSSGQDGFNLSIFGFDPDGDHHRITQQMAGRRINFAIPEESLMVEKATETVPHTGGKNFDKDSDSFRNFVEWVKKGALKDDPKTLPDVVGVDVYPLTMVMRGAGAYQQMTVRARYSDGTDRDVTELAVFGSTNEPTATISDLGLVTAVKRGEGYIMARYDDYNVAAQVIVIPKGLKYTKPTVKEANYIDKLVHQKLNRLRIVPSGNCTDEEYLRRVYLDVVGILPTVDEYKTFMADKAADKRAKLVTQLLERKEFTEIWVMKWSELLQIRSSRNVNLGMSYKSALLYSNWLKERIAANKPMNEIVIELLSASGGTFGNPATNYYQIERDTNKLMENCAQVFMGMRMQCAQCHNHPFDRWTMDDYYGFSAFFAQVGRKNADDPREKVIYNKGSGEMKHKVGGRVMVPKFLGGETPDVKGKDRRVVLAKWMASPENPFFARNVVNIVWAQFFGIGIVEPVDDVRVSNPPSNPELLSELAAKFQNEYKYDMKKLVQDICNSQAYQRSTKANLTNELDTRNFAKGRIRRQRAEVMLDNLSQLTDTKNKFKGLPLGARAVQIADGGTTNYFLTTFGRASRETVCSCEVKMEPTLSQALHLMNGENVSAKIDSGAIVKKALAAGKKPDQVIDDIYIGSYSRKPTDKEKKALLAQVSKVGADKLKQEQVLNDIFWAILNSKEFMFNH
ncbi:MAG: DUF1549 domain-containing protein [Verrucomicrobiales bacterium]|nr:DUF1549 domain-containing protein [Verrucomicrobiales bacterium]